MPIACLRIPWFALRIALLDQPRLDGHPLILSNPQSGRAIVLDATPEAREQGIRPGMTLREARTRIRARHCSVGRIRRARSRRVGRVIAQSPRPGRRLARGSRVNLVVGRR